VNLIKEQEAELAECYVKKSILASPLVLAKTGYCMTNDPKNSLATEASMTNLSSDQANE
jgi:hypothetical protein